MIAASSKLDETTAEAERNLIAACLAGTASFGTVTQTVSGADFQNEDHGRVFCSIADSFEAFGAAALSERSILSSLKRAGLLRLLGDNFQVAQLVKDGRHTRQSATFFAKQVAQASRNRRARATAMAVVQQVERGRDWDEIASETLSGLEAINSGFMDDEPLTGPEIKQKALETLRSGEQSLCPSGYVRFDQTFGGFPYGGLTIVAARPSVGKSLVSGDIALRVAEMGKKTLLVSLEMSEIELGYRFLARNSDIALREFRQDTIRNHLGTLEDTELHENLRVWVKSQVTIEQIEAMVRKLKATVGLDLVVIDYLGLMGGASSNVYERVTINSQRAKQLAIRHNVAVSMCSQLNREAEKGEPSLANLALSGSVEQDADMILFLGRDKMNEPDKMRMNVMKNRNGEIGYLDFVFDGAHARLHDHAPGEPYVGEINSAGDFQAWNEGEQAFYE